MDFYAISYISDISLDFRSSFDHFSDLQSFVSHLIEERGYERRDDDRYERTRKKI